MRWTRVKSRVVGRPIPSAEAAHELIPKRYALPVFASDPLSSVAYATEEAMLVLGLAGVAAFAYITPVSLAVAALLAIVVISYFQTIRAYPDGGGAFIVATENLGVLPGAVAAAALLTDYLLTVAVSVAAGTAAVTSALPDLRDSRVPIAVGFVVLLTVANLRGLRESSRLFAAPTYLFVASVAAVLVAGFVSCADGTCPTAASADAEVVPLVGGVSLFLLLRAFASGSTALTGVEAIANGVQAFRPPKSHNAGITLVIMGAISISMFLGISTLARLFEVRATEATIEEYGTVLSQIGDAAFGGGAGYWLLQVFTAAILVLAANTAYQDFPRLSAILAGHRLMPRQYRNQGDRLVFSNGILSLAGLAVILLVLFDASVTRLVQLYVVGVFLSFTLSQAGMVRHWLGERGRGWRYSVVVNAVGAATTGVVLIVVAATKFIRGAWIVLIAIPILVALMLATRRHYESVAAQLRAIPTEARVRSTRALVLVAHHDAATDWAIRYAEMLRVDSVTVIHALEPDSEDLTHHWERLFPQHPLEIVHGEDEPVTRRLVERIRAERDAHPECTITVIVAERFHRRTAMALFRHRHLLSLKARLLFEPRVVLTDVTSVRRRNARRPAPPDAVQAVVLCADLTRPVREALAYAEAIDAPMLAVHVAVEERQTERFLAEWERAGYVFPLEIVPSPYRGITRPLLRYLRRLRHDLPSGTLIDVIIPEFIVPGRIAQFLHNQTGLAIKAVLAPEPGVAVTSVPFHLERSDAARRSQVPDPRS